MPQFAYPSMPFQLLPKNKDVNVGAWLVLNLKVEMSFLPIPNLASSRRPAMCAREGMIGEEA